MVSAYSQRNSIRPTVPCFQLPFFLLFPTFQTDLSMSSIALFLVTIVNFFLRLKLSRGTIIAANIGQAMVNLNILCITLLFWRHDINIPITHNPEIKNLKVVKLFVVVCEVHDGIQILGGWQSVRLAEFSINRPLIVATLSSFWNASILNRIWTKWWASSELPKVPGARLIHVKRTKNYFYIWELWLWLGYASGFKMNELRATTQWFITKL